MVDVEMKEANAAKEEKKGEEAPDKKEPTDHFYELKKVLILMEKASNEKDFRTSNGLTK